MRAGDLVILGVARDAGEDANAQLVEQRLHLPKLARDVVFADDVDVVGRGVIRLFSADDVIEQRFASELVAQGFRANEARRVDRDARLAELRGCLLANRVDVVAGHGRHAGLVDEDRGRIVFLNDFADRAVKPLLAAEDDVGFAEIGGEARPVELGAGGSRVAIVPGTALAGDGAVHEMGYVRNGLQRDLGAVEGTSASRAARLQLLGAALLAFLPGLGLVLGAAGFVEDLLDFVRQRAHSRLLRCDSCTERWQQRPLSHRERDRVRGCAACSIPITPHPVLLPGEGTLLLPFCFTG